MSVVTSRMIDRTCASVNSLWHWLLRTGKNRRWFSRIVGCWCGKPIEIRHEIRKTTGTFCLPYHTVIPSIQIASSASKLTYKILNNRSSGSISAPVLGVSYIHWQIQQRSWNLYGKIERKRVVRTVSILSRVASGGTKMIILNGVMAWARLFMIRVLCNEQS